ncbi:hypothetical protein WISP_137470 [Willisornis vidua]|uniref:Ribulose-1,5-bisphosphate carboxylase/oxygenase large subunit n=1 Tax=Willisornis vidua TaxID=1566151 RepID=A0ABQ9CU09_9PASS|nr:hypothetical protein WISP_137470 [Willisornis vidua]
MESTPVSESQGPEFKSQWGPSPAIPSRQISDVKQGQPRKYHTRGLTSGQLGLGKEMKILLQVETDP